MKAWIGKTKGNFPGTHDLLKLLEEVGEQAWASSKGMRKIRFGQHWKVIIKTLHAGDIHCEWINALLRNEPHRNHAALDAPRSDEPSDARLLGYRI